MTSAFIDQMTWVEWAALALIVLGIVGVVIAFWVDEIRLQKLEAEQDEFNRRHGLLYGWDEDADAR